MQAFIELIAGFIIMLAAAALSQFGVNLDMPRAPDREVHRVADCSPAPAAQTPIAEPSAPC